MFNFSSKPKEPTDPRKQMREWTKGLRQQKRELTKQIRRIDKEERKVKLEIKKAAKANEPDVVRMLAKELVRSRAAKNRILTTQVQMNSVEMQLKNQAAMAKVAGALGKSAEVMEGMSKLMNVPLISAQMRQMAQEMEKAGLIEEMTSDMLDDALGEEDMSDEADEEVEKVMAELTAGKFGTGTVAPTGPVAAAAPAVAAPAAAEPADEELEGMRARMAALDAM